MLGLSKVIQITIINMYSVLKIETDYSQRYKSLHLQKKHTTKNSTNYGLSTSLFRYEKDFYLRPNGDKFLR